MVKRKDDAVYHMARRPYTHDGIGLVWGAKQSVKPE
jgi:hypothetical protein